jgi:hypothetical protein
MHERQYYACDDRKFRGGGVRQPLRELGSYVDATVKDQPNPKKRAEPGAHTRASSGANRRRTYAFAAGNASKRFGLESATAVERLQNLDLSASQQTKIQQILQNASKRWFEAGVPFSLQECG